MAGLPDPFNGPSWGVFWQGGNGLPHTKPLAKIVLGKGLTQKDRTLKKGMYQPAMNTDTATAEAKALNALRTAKTKRALFAALRRISAIHLAARREQAAAR